MTPDIQEARTLVQEELELKLREGLIFLYRSITVKPVCQACMATILKYIHHYNKQV